MKSLIVAVLLVSSKAFSFDVLPPVNDAKSILFLDERYEVLDSSLPEYRSQGQVGPWCTGTLIAPNAVLTAAHCVFNKTENMWYGNLDYSPADDITRNVKWKKAYIPANFKASSLGRNDFAVIILDENLDSYTPLKMVATDEVTAKRRIRISGFPLDWDYNFVESECENSIQNHERTIYRKYKTMFKTVSESFKRRIYNKYKDLSYYKCDTNGGMSGAAVRIQSKPGAFDTVVAVHTTGNKLKNIRNAGTTITSTVLKTINLWAVEKTSPHHKSSSKVNN